MGVITDMFGDDLQTHPMMYRGVVENNNDPEKAGRVKIRVLGIHSDNKGYVGTKDLPWAIPATDLRMGGGLRNIGSYKVPDIGSHVFCFFEAGDHNFPVYFAAAPAIENVTDYQEKGGNLNGDEYEFLPKYQYDDSGSAYDSKKDFHETPNAGKTNHPVQDYPAQTRKNTFGVIDEGHDDETNIPKKDKDDIQSIFPTGFFIEDIRIAFDGAANANAENYSGIHSINPSPRIQDPMKDQELHRWTERKWGFNDSDQAQHEFKGDTNWTPEYPMCSTERNSQGEIIDRDILKERKTYIHPSKYFHEVVQLDSSRERDDFLNETSIKKIYERQRGVANTPTKILSTPFQSPDVNLGSSILEERVDVVRREIPKERVNYEITYDDKEGKAKSKKQKLGRFEERKHNPGREKTIVEDFVYRYYGNKVNETFNVDKNTRIYTGNDNLEIELGDRNYRLHRGSHNQHLDVGNLNRTVNKGWEHLHLDDGHHMIELNGNRPFSTGTGEEVKKMDASGEYLEPQHITVATGEGEQVDGTSSFEDIDYQETDRGSQFIVLHQAQDKGDANQTIRLEQGQQLILLRKGNQTFVLYEGSQGFHLLKGDQYYLLDEGDQKFELVNGDMIRDVKGERQTHYTQNCTELCDTEWTIEALQQVKVKAPSIILDGDVVVTGNMTINKNEIVFGDQNVAGTCTGPTNQA